MSTFNFASLQQKADQVLKNSDEAIRKWLELALAPAKDVPIEYYDQNGNLIQTTVPNRAKLFNDLLVNVNSAMNRIYYVDAVNGSDLNDGSQNAPFKTIKKAVDSVPAGGRVDIILLSDYLHSLEDIYVNGRSVRIIGNRITPKKLQFQIAPRNSYNTVYAFRGGGHVILDGVDISFVDNSDPNLPFDAFAQIFDYYTYAETSWDIFSISSIIRVPDHQYINFIHSNGSGIKNVNIGLIDTEINTAGLNSFPFRITNGILNIASYTHTLTGAKTNFADLISGMVKDTNGIPRNVVSNLIL